MTFVDELTASEFASLKEVAKGFSQSTIPEADARRLLALSLIYRLLGSLRMTRAGNIRIARGS